MLWAALSPLARWNSSSSPQACWGSDRCGRMETGPIPMHPHNRFQVREIHKSAWLRRATSSGRNKKCSERVWVVFCIHDDTNPFLEVYADPGAASGHRPARPLSLKNCRHVSPGLLPYPGPEGGHGFAVTLEREVIHLVADTRAEMQEWVEVIRGRLRVMGILSPAVNLYGRLPPPTPPAPQPTTPSGVSTRRDPNSPLPPPPSLDNSSNPPPDVFDFDLLSHTLTDSEQTYERLYPQEETPMSPPEGNHDIEVQGENLPPPPPPPPLSLKEMQASRLRCEMQHPAGVRLRLHRKDCNGTLALIDYLNTVWIAGWKQRQHPVLYTALHIGDQLASVDGVAVHTASLARSLLRLDDSARVELVVRRVPFGRILVLKRDHSSGGGLGIVLESNNGEKSSVVKEVVPGGPVAEAGLPTQAPTCDGVSHCPWALTEVNGRPLCLFPKTGEVRDRLSAVGRDISVLLQPADLVSQLRRQLKGMSKYKEFLLR